MWESGSKFQRLSFWPRVSLPSPRVDSGRVPRALWLGGAVFPGGVGGSSGTLAGAGTGVPGLLSLNRC